MKTPRCIFKEENPITRAKKPLYRLSIPYFVQHQFMHQNKDQKFKKIGKCAKLQVSKPKMVKYKYNTIGWRIKRSQYLKIHFTAIKNKTLTRRGQKVDFLIQPLDRMNFGSSHRVHFSFWNNSLWVKIRVKTD